MSDRGKEIESFYWLALRLCGLAFGYLLIAGGVLFALAFAIERLRTGGIALGGAVHRDGLTQLWLVAIPALVALAGAGLIRLARRPPPGD